MKNKTLHMIGNAHLDPVWLWQWQEGFHEVKATFRSALDRMNEYPGFIFVSSSAAHYEWVEQSDPAMFAEIKQRVAEGRWHLVGGWWVQPDCNLPGGESFTRQALYAQRYFQEKFGQTARVGYNVDSFGHHAMLPQLLKKSGLDYYIFMRPMPHEKGLPGRLFWWESDDGSRVLAYRLPFEYCTWSEGLDAHVQRCAGEIKPPFTEGQCFYGVGNHGGGPTKENIESILRMDEESTFPNLIFSTPERFFQGAEAANGKLPVPVVHDELQHHASGCYAAHSGVKQWNRRAENALLAAEKWSALASWKTGQPYPAELSMAWKNVLFNQFHDILAGTCIEEAYEDARDQYGEALSIAARAQNLAIQSLAWNICIDPEPQMLPIVVFNPHAWAARVSVELEMGRLPENPGLVDDRGQPVAFQLVQSAATAKERNRLLFLADLPPLGYRTYRLIPNGPGIEPPQVDAGNDFIENERYRLEIDPDSGAIRRLFDRRSQVEVFAGLAARPVVLADDSDTWAHNVFEFNQVEGCFQGRRVQLVENGPVRSTFRVESNYGDSRLTQNFSLYHALDGVAVRLMVDWREPFKALKLRFPANLTHMRLTAEMPYSTIERFAGGAEEPCQSWIDLSGMARGTSQPYGVSILNDGKYSFDVRVRDIGLTVLRSPIYAHHMPVVPDPDASYRFIDHGLQRFNYTILPHAGSWEGAGTVHQAAELNQRPFALAATYHPDGTLPQSTSFVESDHPNVVVTALKQAEDNDDLIVRCVEMHKEACQAVICFPHWNRAIQTGFGPCEIKTFRIPKDPNKPVVETNLLEGLGEERMKG